MTQFKNDLVAKYGKEVGTRLADMILSIMDNDNYLFQDNFSIAEVGTADVERHKKQREKGCCGSYDDLILLDGRMFVWGFNYGH